MYPIEEFMTMLGVTFFLVAFAYGCYHVFYRSRFDKNFDNEEVIYTKRCPNCGCINIKNAKSCKECGTDI